MGCGASVADGSASPENAPEGEIIEYASTKKSDVGFLRDSMSLQANRREKWAGPLCVGNLGGPTPVRLCSASEDGRAVAAIMHDGRPIILTDKVVDQAAQAIVIGSLDYLGDQEGLCCTVHPSGLFLAFYTWNPKARMAPRKLTLLGREKKGSGWEPLLRRESSGLYPWTDCSFADCEEGLFFVGGASDGQLMLVNISGTEKEDVKWRPMWKSDHPGAELTCVACHAVCEASIPCSAASILLGFSDGVVELWLSSPDETHGDPKLLRRLEGYNSPIRGISLNVDENLAVTISDDGFVRVWDHQGSGEVIAYVTASQGTILSAALVAPNVLVTCQNRSPVLTVWHLEMKQAVLLLGWPANSERPSGNSSASSNVWTFSADSKAQCCMLASTIACGYESSMYVWQLGSDVISAVNELVPALDEDMQVIQSAEDGMPALLDGLALAGSGLKLTLRPLLIAASSGRSHAVSMLLASGESPEVGTDPSGNTCLHLAAHYQRWTACSLLARACVGRSELLAKTNNAGMTVLHVAASRAIPDAVFYDLVHAGFPLHVIDIRDQAGKTALQYAAEANDMHAVMLLGRMGADLFAFDFPAGSLSAHKEAISLVHQLTQSRQARNTELFFALINSEANLLAAFVPDEDGDSQIHHAARKDDLGLLQPLLEMGSSCGIEPDVRNRPAMATPLHIAVESGQIGSCRLLMSHGCNVDAVQQGGLTALHLAVSGRRIDIIEEIMKNGANVDLQSDDGLTPLSWAVGAGYLSMSRLLLDKYSADPNLYSPQSGSAIMAAVKEGNLSLCRLLVKHGALPVGADMNGTTAEDELLLHAAVSLGHHEDTLDLVRSVAEIVEDLDVKDNNGCPAVILGREKGGQKLSNLLLELGADPNVSDRDGNTLLHGAARRGDSAAIHTLYNFGASLDLENLAGFTPLYESLTFKDPPAYAAAEALLKLGADATLTYGDTKDTLLHIMASVGDERAVSVLLSAGASPGQRNQAGKCPADVAANESLSSTLLSAPEPEAKALDLSREQYCASKAQERKQQMSERSKHILDALAAQQQRRQSRIHIENLPDAADSNSCALIHPFPAWESEGNVAEGTTLQPPQEDI